MAEQQDMSGTKHTPGPWEAVEVGQGGPADNPMPVFEIHAGSGRAVVAEYVAGRNASLIAAAPEMYEALLAFDADDSPVWDWVNAKGIGSAEYRRRSAVVDRMRAALAKATGEQS